MIFSEIRLTIGLSNSFTIEFIPNKLATYWICDGLIHRDDGPAIDWLGDGGERKEWWVGGRFQRAVEPALRGIR